MAGWVIRNSRDTYWLTIPPGAVPAISSLLSPPLWNVPATEVETALLTRVLSVMRTVDPATPLRPTVVLYEIIDLATFNCDPLAAAAAPVALLPSNEVLTV